MKTNTKIVIAVIVVLIVVLLFWGKKNQNASISFWNETGIECLTNGHVNLGQHIHPTIKIFIDEAEVPVPANIGVTSTCMAEVHTHDEAGVIHIESVDAGKGFGIQDFFTVWGEDFEKEGYERVVTVNGEEVDPWEYRMKDLDEIVVSYITGEGTVNEGAGF